MQHSDEVRRTLLAVRSVLDQVRPTAFSRNFEDLANVVMLGLWEPGQTGRTKRVDLVPLGSDAMRTGKRPGFALDKSSYLRN